MGQQSTQKQGRQRQRESPSSEQGISQINVIKYYAILFRRARQHRTSLKLGHWRAKAGELGSKRVRMRVPDFVCVCNALRRGEDAVSIYKPKGNRYRYEVVMVVALVGLVCRFGAELDVLRRHCWGRDHGSRSDGVLVAG